MIVMKFGGTSVGNAERIRNVANIVKSNIGKKPIVVVSAVTKITDMLLKLANESIENKREETLENIRKTHNSILEMLQLNHSLLDSDFTELQELFTETKNNKNLDAKTLDHFQSFGERMSSKIVAGQLNKIGVRSFPFNSWDLGLVTNDDFGNAEPLELAYGNIKNQIKKLNVVPVITGFIAKTRDGIITTLGRGGSDYTAAIFGASINAEEIQIWTDVNGMMSTDPKIVENARTIPEISFAEASELAYFGAKVLHPKTILPAVKKNIPVKVLNSFYPENGGTIILNKISKSKDTIKAIAYKKNIALVHVNSLRMLGNYGFLSGLFETFNKYKKSVDVVSTSEVSVSLTLDNEQNIDKIVNELKEFASVKVSRNKSIICVVGEGMRNTPGISGRVFTTLGNNQINVEMISQGASEINITFIIDGNNTEKAVKMLHDEYFGEKNE